MKQHLKAFARAVILVATSATVVGAGRLAFVETPPDLARPNSMSDPVEDAVRREILAKTPEQHQKPAPFLNLAIPDPLEIPKTVGLRDAPVDSDPPSASIPPRPVLGSPAK